MQNPSETPDSAQVDRFADRLLNALANLDRYANGYHKREELVASEANAPVAAKQSE